MTDATTILRGMTEGLDLLSQTRAEGMIDYPSSLVDFLERQYIHTRVARLGDAEA